MLRGLVERERLDDAEAGASTTRRSTSTVISSVGSSSTARVEPVDDLGGELAPGTSPFLVQLLRKMSAKRGEITASKP